MILIPGYRYMPWEIRNAARGLGGSETVVRQRVSSGEWSVNDRIGCNEKMNEIIAEAQAIVHAAMAVKAELRVDEEQRDAA